MSTAHDFDFASTCEHAPLASTGRDDRELIRFATLAASSHNTQPWRFRSAADSITIQPDLARRCRVVDPDDAHLYRSLGCATENLVQAAAAQGLATHVRFDPAQDAVVIELTARRQRRRVSCSKRFASASARDLPSTAPPSRPKTSRNSNAPDLAPVSATC